MADTDDKDLAEELKASPIMQSMLAQPRKPRLTQADANSTQLASVQKDMALRMDLRRHEEETIDRSVSRGRVLS